MLLLSATTIALTLLLRYAWLVVRYRQARDKKDENQVPPAYPAYLPWVGNIVSVAWDIRSFIHRTTHYNGVPTAAKVSILGYPFYVFQDRESISKIMRHPCLSSPMSLYVFGQRILFDMPEKGVAAYIADDSGPSAKPFPGSQVPPAKRVDYLLHKAFNQAWTGTPLSSTSRRFMKILSTEVNSLEISDEWMEIDDFFKFFGKALSNSVTESIFGPALLQLNPNIIEDAWEFDEVLPWLFRCIPSCLYRHPHMLRKRLSKQILRWYAYARQWFTDDSIYSDGDGDPFWGSGIIRQLQRELLKSGEKGFIDDECFAAHDMGLIWGSNSNVIAAAMLAACHVFQDRTLLERVRCEVDSSFPRPFSLENVDHKQLFQLPLLSSIYSEILRLYVDVMLVFSSPHVDVRLGKWCLPKGEKALISTSIAHKDDSIWNTYHRQHPLDSFWAERFIVDPADPYSGPLRPELKVIEKYSEGKKPYYSSQGLDGVWIPFGGGPSMCPGRFLAKAIVMSTCALLVSRFDIEVLASSIETSPLRFGLGVSKPARPIGARVKARQQDDKFYPSDRVLSE
ncbi:cytochrome P450 [Xylariaceae sp. FL1019]|nr:cytochrome P450 [Xylariaceae sp. FL1019]